MFLTKREAGFTRFQERKPKASTEHMPSPRLAANSKPLHCLTVDILRTYKKIDPTFHYNALMNPKRSLTAPFEGVSNNNFDNINNDYILRVNDIIISPDNDLYIIEDLLGKGTFGQVVKCRKKSLALGGPRGQDGESVAIKVIKNKIAHTQQALVEIRILKLLNRLEERYRRDCRIVKMMDYFAFRNHIFIVFELLGSSLYDLLRETDFNGLTLSHIRQIMTQLLEAGSILEQSSVIHCDLKPENILIDDVNVKLIDLGSACLSHYTPFMYIQSRYYRAPEVIIGTKYTSRIDSWSLGCIAAELYLGYPIFPGSCEYHQLALITELLGAPDTEMITSCKHRAKFFRKTAVGRYTLTTLQEYERNDGRKVEPQPKWSTIKSFDELHQYYDRSESRSYLQKGT